MKEVKGCGMRSSVGFLSQRRLFGNPLMKEEFQRLRLAGCTSLYKKDMLGHFGCVNAIEFSNNGGEYLVSGGDDRRVLLWDMERVLHARSAKPLILKGEHLSNIFCLAFDSTNKRVFSGGNDEQVILHDVEQGETLNVFLHDDAVYGLSVSPVNDNVFASSSDDGRVLIWDTRQPPHGEPFCLANYPSAFHSVMFNPAEPRLLATANSKEGVGLWDIRKPRTSLLRYGGSTSLQSAMSVRFNSAGTQLLALRRRLPPVLYELHSRLPSFQFDNQGYFNSCTMKSCCFAGDKDQYVLSGSDDFNLYMWRIPKDPEAGGPGRVVNGASMILKGHRSIVNQVRFNPSTNMICSSGVEKVIKAWSPYQQTESLGDLDGCVENKSRSLYSHEEYISLVLNSGSGLRHDYVSQSIQEDPRMMAFFDSLVRREIEGWSSDSDSDLSEGAILQLQARGRGSTRAGRDGAGVLVGVGAASPVHPAAATGDSDRSSSSSLAAPDASGAEPLLPRSRQRHHQSAFLLDLVGEDSDSSGFWLDPMPRPSPRDNSTLSSPPSSPAGASSSSSTTSSTSSEDEERRRVSTRQRNAARRRRMHFPCRPSGGRPESAQALYPGGVDSCSYPKISIDEASSSSASSTELQQDQDSVQIGPQRRSSKTGRCASNSGRLAGSGPAVSLDSQDDRAEQEGLLITSLLAQDTLQQRTESWEGGMTGAALERMAKGLESPEEDNSSWVSPSSRHHHSPDMNGLRLPDQTEMTEVPVDSRDRLAPDLFASPHSRGEREALAGKQTDTRNQVEDEKDEEEAGLSSQRGQAPAQGALKRTHLGSGGQGSGEGLETSPSEKKFKT
ncbi:DDB1- and CUL4-associated factor 5-like isoform X1 [Salvelinus namaycush]|uniref:DDB1- and CUL4-associated factor 5-like isoform X1 n=1 Tax=Salvelinus namaycush TaxID=8040 RepID=A0A8U0PDR6_SALNM|nr:DDB1- and CUL4-associated factor 5-like isoform X1 [Salvelinus namaycush]XP_038822972.1 DDB1- and CUL4-associated factor 5-like isoform X1 [Salvelinus namaycush]